MDFILLILLIPFLFVAYLILIVEDAIKKI